MKHFPHVLLIPVLVFGLLAVSISARGQDPARTDPASESAAPPKPALPPLSNIVSLSAALQVELAMLENEVDAMLDPQGMEKDLQAIRERTDNLEDQFSTLQKAQEYTLNTIVGLHDAVKQESKALDAASQPIVQTIQHLGAYRETWLAEKSQWADWQQKALEERGLDQLRPTFREASQTINKALNLVLPRLDAMFTVQDKGADISVRLNVLAYELDEMIVEERRGGQTRGIAPILSVGFFTQFLDAGLWTAVISAPLSITWPGPRFFGELGWIILLQIGLTAVVITTLRRNRARLEKSHRLGRLSRRTFSVGLFVGYVATMLIYETQGSPVMVRQALSLVAVFALGRLWTVLIETTWKKRCVYALVTLLIIVRVLEMLSVPLPVLRLFTIVTAIIAIIVCWRWARRSMALNEPRIHAWVLYAASLLFTVVLVAELSGKAPFPFFVLTSMLSSAAALLFFQLLISIIHECIEWLFKASFIQKNAVLQRNAGFITQRTSLFAAIIIHGLLVIPSLLVIWGAFGTLDEAVRSLLDLGFAVGDHRISVGLLAVAVGFVYFSFLLSWLLQNLLLDAMLLKRRVERGVRASIKSLAHYVLISIGFLLAISSLGLELTKLTILISALGVGIGFGLQSIVNNFVSGLILLFERPVRVGDYIELNGNWCEIQRIGLRATTVQTFDQADVVIPNADLISNQVTNWTLRNRTVRVIIPVGVAYGSDIPLVIKTLEASAVHPMVAANPAPQVLFLRFGESSLDFELRVWVTDVDQMLTTRSDLHQEIDRRFREEGIEIAFPQRDVHFRSMERPIPLPESVPA
jgi:potassium-dependent mechanosensitive channel